jgi:hypothetical protein
MCVNSLLPVSTGGRSSSEDRESARAVVECHRIELPFTHERHSGRPNIDDTFEYPPTEAAALAFAAGRPRQSQPGEKSEYDHTEFTLLKETPVGHPIDERPGDWGCSKSVSASSTARSRP